MDITNDEYSNDYPPEYKVSQLEPIRHSNYSSFKEWFQYFVKDLRWTAWLAGCFMYKD